MPPTAHGPGEKSLIIERWVIFLKYLEHSTVTNNAPCRRIFLFLFLITIMTSIFSSQAAADGLPTVGSVERLHPDIDALISPSASIEVLAKGFKWSEGPVWIPNGDGGLPPQSLLFSDIPNNRIHCWNTQSGLSVFLEPAGFTGPASYGKERGSNGLALDTEGRLLCCEHGDRRISVLEKNGGKRTLADAWDGNRFNSPNDLAVHASGAIYFTDPPYGLPDGFNDARREIDFCGVFRIQPNGNVDLLCKTMTRPNGIAFSPDQKKLYVAQSDPDAPILKVFNVSENGMLDAGKTFFDATTLSVTRKGNPDGLAVDTKGNLFATGPGGVLVIAADGTHLGTILTGQKTANCCFGEDGRSLFMTADMLLCRIQLTTSGW